MSNDIFDKQYTTEKATLFAELLDVSREYVTSYHSDYWHDACWIDNNWQKGMTFWYGVGNLGCGTHIGFDQALIERYTKETWQVHIQESGCSIFLRLK
jgi:hypothetical protein